MESLLSDLRYSVRQFRRVPLLVAAIVGTLALAVGANTLLFAIANAALFRALPYPDASQVVSFSLAPKGRDVGRIDEPTMRLAAERGVAALEAVSFYDTTSATIAGGEYPERFAGGRVSEAFFDVLRTRPALGRTFTGPELRAGGPAVIVLGDGLWTRRFGRDAAIVGQRIQLDDRSYEVVGVMPPGFSYPGSAEFWLPYISRRLPPGGMLFVDAIGRLRPSASVEQARSALAALGQAVTAEMKNAFVAGYELRVVPLQERLYGDFTRPLVLLLAMVACVVLIGCANIANLLLARSSARRTELAIRAAMGASGRRICRQLLAESLLLAGGGAVAGLILAYAGLRLFRAFGPPALVRLPSLAIDGQVLLFTLALTIVTGLLFGLAPALSAARVDPADRLKGARGSSADRRGRPRRALVALEIAAAVVLLLGAALLTRSFLRYQDVDRGFDGYNVLTASITLSPARYADGASRRVFFERLTAQLRALPDVESVAVTNAVLSGMIMTIPWKPGTSPDGQVPEIAVGGSGDGHYRTFGIPMVEGRECAGAADGSAVVINKSMAFLAFGERSAVGRSIDLSAFGMGAPNVLGVSADVRNVETKAPPRPTVYECNGGVPGASSIVALRVREGRPALALTPALRSAVRALDPAQPLTRVRTVEQIVREGMSARWFDALVIAALAALALILALGGLYAVTAYAVAQRTREIGLRLALGADRGAVMRMVLLQGGAMVGAGVALGLAAGVPMVRFVSARLFDVKPLDPAVFALVTVAVGLTALLATFVPAWRASRVDPMIALRAE
ncbi:MAG TPA: ABC transporter permease [Vicinamibacterales bacterium]|nr:ABC transporter permease [Vicinamibacterales bacterium]